MQVEHYICDLCKKDHLPTFWWDSAKGGCVTVVPDGINNALQWKHLCTTCRTMIYNSVLEVVQKRSPKVSGNEQGSR